MSYPLEIIKSPQNQLFKRIKGLNLNFKSDCDYFVIEGERPISCLSDDYSVECFALSESYYAKMGGRAVGNATFHVFADVLFERMSDTKNPQGILAVAKQRRFSIVDIPLTSKPLVIVLERCNDPGNLGAIIRTACAAGANGVIVSKGSCAVYNPKTLRASAGCAFMIPVVEDADILDCVKTLKSAGVTLYAACPGESSAYAHSYKSGTAFLIGNEANGLTHEALALSDHRVGLPITGGAESLNAAVACGILIYEAVRQRT